MSGKWIAGVVPRLPWDEANRIARGVGEVFVTDFGMEWETKRRGHQSSLGFRY